MNHLDLIKLSALMGLTSGRTEITVGLIDGPVATDHPELTVESIREIHGGLSGRCAQVNSVACVHGTFVAGVLCSKRSSAAPAICPNCTLLVRPIYAEEVRENGEMPSATPEELAAAVIECVDAGARVINLSSALLQTSATGERQLREALDYAAKRNVIVVAAAGNQGTVGSSAITSHPWVIPVVACDHLGKPLNQSNLGSSIGRRGLSAPGDKVTSLGTDGKTLTLGGTSVATPFVSGAIALLWSEFPYAPAARVKLAITQGHALKRASIVPPLLDAWAAYQVMTTAALRGSAL